MKLRVYLANKHAVLRRGLAKLIDTQDDLQVCGETADFAAALAEIAALRPDVVVVDIPLGGAGSLPLLKRIKALDRRIRVVLLSVHDATLLDVPPELPPAQAGVYATAAGADVLYAIRGGSAPPFAVRRSERAAAGPGPLRDPRMARLSAREFEVAALIGAGHSTREIAMRLRLSVPAVNAHRVRIKAKAGLPTAVTFVQFCIDCHRALSERNAARGLRPRHPAPPSSPSMPRPEAGPELLD